MVPSFLSFGLNIINCLILKYIFFPKPEGSGQSNVILPYEAEVDTLGMLFIGITGLPSNLFIYFFLRKKMFCVGILDFAVVSQINAEKQRIYTPFLSWMKNCGNSISQCYMTNLFFYSN